MIPELDEFEDAQLGVARNTSTARMDASRLYGQVDETEADPAELPKPYTQPVYQRGQDYWTEDTARDYYDVKREADDSWWLTDDIPRQFMHGGNIGVDVYKEFARKMTSGPSDPNWTNASVTAWLDGQNDIELTPEQRSYFYGTTNIVEARMLLDDLTADLKAQRVMALRGGFKTFTAGAIAGLVDIDTPLAVLSGGLSKAGRLGITATRTGRLLAGAAAGGLVGGTAGYIDYAVNPASDPESVALMALFGAGFGMIGARGSRGLAEDATAGMRNRVADELGEQVEYGRPPERLDAEQVTIDGVRPDRLDAVQGTLDEAADINAKIQAEADKINEIFTTSPERGPAVFSVYDVEIEGPEGTVIKAPRGTLSAASTDQWDGLGISDIKSTESKRIIADMTNANARDPAIRDYEDVDLSNTGAAEPAVRKALRFRDAAHSIGILTDYDRFMKSGNAVMQWLSVNLLESASSIGRNKITAATQMENYKKQFSRIWEGYKPQLTKYMYEEAGYKTSQWFNTWPGQGIYRAKEAFDHEVITELMAMRFGGQGTLSAAAKEVAHNVWQKGMDLDHSIGLGRAGQMPLDGYQNFTPGPGYIQQIWSGRKMADALRAAAKRGGKAAKDKLHNDMVDFIDREYAKQAPAWDAKQRRAVARAVVDTALTRRQGLMHDLIALLNGDAKDVVEDALARNGVSKADIDSVLKSLTGSREAKTQLGTTMHRQDVDFRASDPQTGLRMLDMLETDLEFMYAQRAQRTSGMAALARFGIKNRVEWEAIKKAAIDLHEARGQRITNSTTTMDKIGDFIDRDPFANMDSKDIGEYMDAMYGYFTGIRPNAGTGTDVYIQRMKKLTQLSLMNQMGITQTADFGSIAGAVGWSRFMRHAGEEFRMQLSKADSPLVQELRTFSVFSPEETMFNGRLMQQLDRANPGNVGAKFDAFLNEATRLQAAWSGFNYVRNVQQRIAIGSVTSKLWEGFKSGKEGFTPDRMRDMGFDNAFMQRVLPHATFTKDVELQKLNMHLWTPDDVELFQNSMARSVNQMVLKAMAGEENWAFKRNGIMQLLMQFKSFPMLSIEKSFMRNARYADATTVNMFVAGLVFGGASYVARQAVNAKTENLTPERIARGAMNYSAMIGWIPMFTDPVLGAMGVDTNLGGYAQHGVGSVISLPASFTVAERLTKAPAALFRTALAPTPLTELSNDDIRTLQYLPVFGNMYGINAALNMLKD